MMRKCAKLRLLLWKDWKLQARHPCITALQIIIPVMCTLLLVYERWHFRPEYHDVTRFDPFEPIRLLNETEPNEEMRTEITLKIAWTMKGNSSKAIQKEARIIMQSFVENGIILEEFPSEERLISYLMGLGVMDSEDGTMVLCGVIFEDSTHVGKLCSRGLQVTLRFPAELRTPLPRTSIIKGNWNTDLIFPPTEGPGPTETVLLPIYYGDGFLTVQYIISSSVVQHCTKNETLLSILREIEIDVRAFPFPPYHKDKLLKSLNALLSLALVVSFMYTCTSTVKAITTEKELQLKESMKIMGLSSSLHWAAWFIKTMLFYFVIVVMIVVLLRTKISGAPVLRHTSTTILLAFLFMYMMATTCFCFMMSVFFSNANVAAIMAGLMWFVTYFPVFYIQENYDKSGLEIKLLLSLFLNTAMSLGTMILLRSEGTEEGIQWSNLCKPVTITDNLCLSHILLMLLCDSMLYMAIALYIENIFPGEYGVAKPWYFFFQKSHWDSTRWKSSIEDFADTLDPNNFEEEPHGLEIGIKLRKLRKVYSNGKVAVHSLSLKMYEGQITVLLGHNGAGKSTAMNMLTGMYIPTSGTAMVNGHDIVKDTDAARESLGLCPQHNVLFNELTVREHLYFFSKLKGLSGKELSDEIDRYVVLLNLVPKMHVKAHQLSGGMKRKLAIGVALCGNSKVVMLDEPTSGVDPAARHSFWDIMRAVKPGRTILLTTHFMDEADSLGDRIAIMANGRLLCCGSPFFLKKRYGSGYKLVIEKGRECVTTSVTALLQRHIPRITPSQDVGKELSYQLNESESPVFQMMLRDLEISSEELDVLGFGISVTTMEDVFIKTAEQQDHWEQQDLRSVSLQMIQDEELYTGKRLKYRRLHAMFKKKYIVFKRSWLVFLVHCMLPALFFIVFSELTRIALSTTRDLPPLTIDLKAGDVCYVTYDTSRVLQQGKNFIFHSNPHRNIIQDAISEITICCQIMDIHYVNQRKQVLSIYFTGTKESTKLGQDGSQRSISHLRYFIDMHFSDMTSKSGRRSMRKIEAHVLLWNVPTIFSVIPRKKNYESSLTAVSITKDAARADGGVSMDPIHVLERTWYENYKKLTKSGKYTQRLEDLGFHDDEIETFDSFVLEEYKENFKKTRHTFIVGASFGSHFITTWFNDLPLHSVPLTLHLLMNALLDMISVTLKLINHPLPFRLDSKIRLSSEQVHYAFIVAVVFSYGFVAAYYILFPVKERNSKSKHLQLVSGVEEATFWVINLAWDGISFLLPCILLIIVLAIYQYDGFSSSQDLGRILILLICFGWSVLPLTYLASFVFALPATGYTVMSLLYALGGYIVYSVVYYMLVEYPNQFLEKLNWFLLIIPHYCLADAITSANENNINLKSCEGRRKMCHLVKADHCCPGKCPPTGCWKYSDDFYQLELPGIGRNILFFICGGILFIIIIFIIEFRHVLWTFCNVCKKSETLRAGDEEESEAEDSDVLMEKKKIRAYSTEELKTKYNLVLRDVTKYYGKILAVKRICLGVKKGECFGLLGANGAGKTTTFKMMTGDEIITHGEAYIQGFSLKTKLREVRQRIGYCPQFDALIDVLTGRETLHMFCLLRGISNRLIPKIITQLSDSLLFSPFLDKTVKTYSGGNKRKLSTAVALVGNPPVVFLDEPTTGMDPVARRSVWNVLCAIRAGGTSIIFTSHSMDECEALCTRIAIMVNGNFKCLGSLQHLKNKFAKGYTLQVKVKAPSTKDVRLPTSVKDTIYSSINDVKHYVRTTFPGSVLREEYLGLLTYSIPVSDLTYSDMFGSMEKAKEQLHIEDYTLGQTNLEQVFLTFTKDQEERI